MAAGDVYRTVVQGLMNGNEWVNVLHFKELASGPDLPGLHAGLKTTLYDVIKTKETPSWSIGTITSTQLVVGGGPQLVSTYNQAGTNATAAGEGALTNCEVISIRSNLSGRSHRGRMYIPIDAADLVGGGKVNTAFYTGVDAAANALKLIYGNGGSDTFYRWVIWSRKLGETVVGGHVTAYNYAAGAFEVYSLVPDHIVRVQRRREFGKGA